MFQGDIFGMMEEIDNDRIKYEFQETAQENLSDVGDRIDFRGDIDGSVSLGSAFSLLTYVRWDNFKKVLLRYYLVTKIWEFNKV